MDTLVGVGFDALTDAQVLDGVPAELKLQHESEVRVTALVAQIDQRGLAQTYGCKNTVQFLRQAFRFSASEAAATLRLAAAVSPRHTLTGQVLAPAHPQTAEAFAAGRVSAAAAEIVIRTVDRLPDCVLEDAHPAVEKVLLDLAEVHDPQTLAVQAKRLSTALDQDGALRDAEQAARRRSADLRRFPDGSGLLSAQLTAEAAEYLETAFDALGKPAPAEDGAPDPRTPAQRRHDALLAVVQAGFGSGRLPTAGGCATTLVLRMEVDDYATDTGVATTGHGYPVPVSLAKRWLAPETQAILVLLSTTRGITAYSSKQRLFTEQQRLAMFARDRGCSYPGCDAALGWLDAHHVTNHADTHRTSVDDGTLVCGTHHDTFHKMGWTSTMLNGQPHWVPPDWIDPERKPRRNHMHDRE